MLTVSSFVTLSEWFIRITDALSSVVLWELALWILYRSLDAWASLSFATNSVFNPIFPSVRMEESLETNPQACSALELMPNIPELRCSPVEQPSLLLGSRFRILSIDSGIPTQQSHRNSFQQRPALPPALLSICCLAGSRLRRKLSCLWCSGVWSTCLKYSSPE